MGSVLCFVWGSVSVVDFLAAVCAGSRCTGSTSVSIAGVGVWAVASVSAGFLVVSVFSQVCVSFVVFWFFRVHVLRVFWSAVCHSFSLGFYIVCVLVFFVVFYPVFSLCCSPVCGGVFFLVFWCGVYGGILPGVSFLVFSLVFFQVLFQGSWGSVGCVVLPVGVFLEFWARYLLGHLCGDTCTGFLCCTFPSWRIGRWCCKWSCWGWSDVFFLGGVFGFPLWWCCWFLVLLFSCLLSFLWWLGHTLLLPASLCRSPFCILLLVVWLCYPLLLWLLLLPCSLFRWLQFLLPAGLLVDSGGWWFSVLLVGLWWFLGFGLGWFLVGGLIVWWLLLCRWLLGWSGGVHLVGWGFYSVPWTVLRWCFDVFPRGWYSFWLFLCLFHVVFGSLCSRWGVVGW